MWFMSEKGAPAARRGTAATTGGASLAGLPVTAIPEYLPGVFAAQWRAGLVDVRTVHLFELPTLAVLPNPLVAYCGLHVKPDDVETVEAYVGALCVTCLLTAPSPVENPRG